MYPNVNARTVSGTTHQSLGRNNGWLHWGRRRLRGARDAGGETFHYVPFGFQVLCREHKATMQKEFLKIKYLHKIQQRQEESVREGPKMKKEKDNLRKKGEEKSRESGAFNLLSWSSKTTLIWTLLFFLFFPQKSGSRSKSSSSLSWSTTTDVFLSSLIPRLSSTQLPPVNSSVAVHLLQNEVPAGFSIPNSHSFYFVFEVPAALNPLLFLRHVCYFLFIVPMVYIIPKKMLWPPLPYVTLSCKDPFVWLLFSGTAVCLTYTSAIRAHSLTWHVEDAQYILTNI